MRRVLAAGIALLLAVLPAVAQEFDGRPLIVTDGRSDTRPAALVIVLHGLFGTGGIMQRKTGYDALARAHGFVVAYPNGIGRRWRDGPETDDVAYLTALIDRLTHDMGTDPDGVHLVGYSNGGSMVLRLACAIPDRLRGIAVVAMTQPRDNNCHSGPIIPALFIHGALDPIVPPNGIAPTRNFDGLLPLTDTLALWSRRNRCAGSAPTQVFDQVEGPDTARVTRYTGCEAPLNFVNLTGQGHDWPGATPRLTLLLGPASRELDAGTFTWRFFSSL